MRALAGPPVLRIRPPSRNARFHDEARERKGNYPAGAVVSSYLPGGVKYASGQRVLSDEDLWSVYRLCPEVRASIEAVVRVISTWDWYVSASEDLSPSDPLYEAAEMESERVWHWLREPNLDGETWQALISKLTRDLMVYDRLAAENVLDESGRLEEIVSLPGRTVCQIYDHRQRLLGYKQTVGTGIGGRSTSDSAIYFTPEQVVYMNLFPSTEFPGGMPIIESLINEVITLMRASKHVMLAYDADEVAPGVLVLAGIAGKSAERAVRGIQNMRGSDHKIRVLTSDNPRGIDAKWVEFRHTPKDLDMKDIVKEIRRTVWRLFGTKPVSMGDSESTPRATAEVQAELEDSGMVRPILEQLEALINLRVIPLLVDDPALVPFVKFHFDLEQDQSSADAEAEARSDASDFDRGALTVNEIRAKRGRIGVEGGDVVLIKQGNQYAPLALVTQGDQGDSEPEAGHAATLARPGGSRGGVRRRSGRPPMARHSSPPRGGFRRDCACGGHHSEPLPQIQRRAADGMPSDWQPEGKFRDARTVDLVKLASEISSYRAAVTPLYRRARIDVVRAFQAVLADGTISGEEAVSLATKINTSLDRLSTQWETATQPRYRAAARLGRDAAVHFSGVQVVEDWRDRGDRYHERAMGYLRDSGGLISDLRSQLDALIGAAMRGTPTHKIALRATASRQVVDPEVDLVLTVLAGVARVFERNEHRIDNWSGRLVELSTDTIFRGLQESEPGAGGGDEDPEGEGRTAEEWWYGWVAVGDEQMCQTCEQESRQGFRPLSALSIEPGGATECRARCRCVLTFWTRSEVDSGSAVDLN